MDDEDEPKQTTPKGAEIPIPKRGDFFKNLRKAAKPKKDSGDSGPEEKEPEGS
ncbi:MAG: hypothetical protein M3046_08425 [Actinomycetota bacterium]|nr:hypothetical protein [Actinomycetota bacterium]